MKGEARRMAKALIVLRLKSSVLGGGRQMARDYGREVGKKLIERR